MEVKISISSKKGDAKKMKDKRKNNYSEKKERMNVNSDSENCGAYDLNSNKMSLNKKEINTEELPEITDQLVKMGNNKF